MDSRSLVGQHQGSAIRYDLRHAKSQALAEEVIVPRRGQWVGLSPREDLLEWSVKHRVSCNLAAL